ncbi:MAG TPA: VWA domain-containing protein [Gaiellaceae bacterium]|nr:VWA domain-containing protein [Gaiellaceae bacterium]
MGTARNRARRRLLGTLTALASLTVTLVAGAAVAAPGVTPATVTDEMLPGETATIAKSVETSPIPPRPDIFFLADTTGSMGGAIANVRTNAASVMSQVLAAQPDAQFGVGEYKDVGDAFVYRLNQAITANTTDVQTGINAWAASGGGDTPEAQLFALQSLATSAATGFRTGSSRIVVWFGDAPGHDPSNGATEASATAALVAAGIRVIAISTGANQLNATGQATRITNATGGVFLPGASDSQVADAILAGLQNLPATVTHSVTCPAGVSATLTPASQTVTSGGTVNFSETYGVDAGTLAGTYVCTVDFLVNGVAGGPAFRETITITVPAPDLAITKTGPALVTEGNDVTYTVTASNLGPTTATGVTVSDPVPAGSTFVSASAGCTQAAGVVTCTAGTLAPGASAAFTIVVKAGSGTSLTNTATVAGDQPDPNLANNSATVVTEINLNPVCTAAVTGLGDLWPPNHKLVSGRIAGVTDPDGDPVSLTITGITQDEPVDATGNGDGNTSPDATIGSGGAFAVRAERAGTGDGRVYAIAFTASDGLGGSCSATLLAGVPHDQGNGDTAVNSAPPSYDSTAP